VGAGGLASSIALPLVLFHRVIGEVVGPFRLDFSYVLGYVPWLLMLIGVIFFVPVALSIGRDPRSRLYPHARNAYAAWGITLYLLGFGLATQVAQLSAGVGAQ
jgi:hypothetical protein